ncbi:MAG: DNA polymerase/3'-5' exonuclease PolX [Phycisphaerae bacterium]|nr:DNA polymerase/3'-5' exonuclease PolX [Phycisphaerae bacterium]
MMHNHELATIFEQIAVMLEILGEDRFRVNSYQKAARVIEELPRDAGAMLADGELAEVAGIGKGTLGRVEEYVKTGKVTVHQELRARLPEGLMGLMAIPGVGPKTVSLAWKRLGVTNVEDLRRVIEDGSLAGLAGMGKKKVEKIRQGLAFVAAGAGRTLLGIALPIAEEILAHFRTVEGVVRVEAAGSLRRWSETVGDIDILVEADEGQRVLEDFVRSSLVAQVLAVGATKASVRVAEDIQVDVRVVPAESFGAALQYFTGSKAHNVRLREIAVKHKWKLNEYGLFKGERRVAGADEEGIYAKLGLAWIPPELREDRGEIENADKLPKLIERSDIRGDLHLHTEASDGSRTIEEMIEACIARGYQYMCITDHSKSSRIANGLDEGRLEAHIKRIRKAARSYERDILVLAGAEVDILADGRLDYGYELLAELDLVTASVHSGLGQPGEKITTRIMTAMDHPYVRIIGHPTGRIIGERAESKLDMARVLSHAAETGTWMELNASWSRLDLKDVYLRQAKEAGVRIAICTDSHDVHHLDFMAFGVYTARRGWLEAQDVVNTLSAKELTRRLAAGK